MVCNVTKDTAFNITKSPGRFFNKDAHGRISVDNVLENGVGGAGEHGGSGETLADELARAHVEPVQAVGQQRTDSKTKHLLGPARCADVVVVCVDDGVSAHDLGYALDEVCFNLGLVQFRLILELIRSVTRISVRGRKWSRHGEISGRN